MASFVELEPLPGQRVELRGKMSIGRDQCEITLEDPEVSRQHASIEIAGGAVTLEDLNSRNGTYVNDESIHQPHQLRDGDVVRLGQTSWRFEATEGAETRLRVEPTALGGPDARRGDVPAPPEHVSVVEPPPPRAGEQSQLPRFVPSQAEPRAEPRRQRASAARRIEATLIAYAVVIATAAAVVIYLAQR